MQQHQYVHFSKLSTYGILLIASALFEDSVKSRHPVTLYKVVFTHHVYCQSISCSLIAPKFGSKRSSEWREAAKRCKEEVHMIVWNQFHGWDIQKSHHSWAFEHGNGHPFKVNYCILVFLTLQEFVGNLDTNSGWPSFQHKTLWNHVIQRHLNKPNVHQQKAVLATKVLVLRKVASWRAFLSLYCSLALQNVWDAIRSW